MQYGYGAAFAHNGQHQWWWPLELLHDVRQQHHCSKHLQQIQDIMWRSLQLLNTPEGLVLAGMGTQTVSCAQ